MSNGKILERIYIKGKLEAVSPLIIGSGADQHTDIDLIRDADNNPFIPGTSLAGSSRHFLNSLLDDEGKWIVDKVFGKKEKESIRSMIMFFDAYPMNNSFHVSVRDGIKLDYKTKTTATHTDRERQSGGAKYDYEIIEPGTVFNFRIALVVREIILKEIQQEKIYDLVYWLLESLEVGKIRVGAKTRRGFGKIKLTGLNILQLDMTRQEDVGKWMDFNWEFVSPSQSSFFRKNKLTGSKDTGFRISAVFEIPYSLLIRHYSINPRDEDACHLMSGNNPVIPGTSWNGAVSHGIYNILMELGYDEAKFNQIKEDLFGIEKGKRPKASIIIFDESTIKGSTSLSYTRNKVDRFTGGTVDSALFDEKPVYGGTTLLNITIKEANQWEVGLILLALRDLGNGIQPVGGDANIGRGVLEKVKITINDEPLIREKEEFYFEQLYNHLEGDNNGSRKKME